MQFEDKVIGALKSYTTTGLFRRCLQEHLIRIGAIAVEPQSGLVLHRGEIAWWF